MRRLAAAARREGAVVPALAGERVLVIGDDSHKAEYRRTVEGMGGSFLFQPGFEAGPRLDAALASATVAAYVAAYAAHRAQDHVRVAERAAVAVVTELAPNKVGFLINKAPAPHDLLGWCRREPRSHLATPTGTDL